MWKCIPSPRLTPIYIHACWKLACDQIDRRVGVYQVLDLASVSTDFRLTHIRARSVKNHLPVLCKALGTSDKFLMCIGDTHVYVWCQCNICWVLILSLYMPMHMKPSNKWVKGGKITKLPAFILSINPGLDRRNAQLSLLASICAVRMWTSEWRTEGDADTEPGICFPHTRAHYFPTSHLSPAAYNARETSINHVGGERGDRRTLATKDRVEARWISQWRQLSGSRPACAAVRAFDDYFSPYNSTVKIWHKSLCVTQSYYPTPLHGNHVNMKRQLLPATPRDERDTFFYIKKITWIKEMESRS